MLSVLLAAGTAAGQQPAMEHVLVSVPLHKMVDFSGITLHILTLTGPDS